MLTFTIVAKLAKINHHIKIFLFLAIDFLDTRSVMDTSLTYFFHLLANYNSITFRAYDYILKYRYYFLMNFMCEREN